MIDKNNLIKETKIEENNNIGKEDIIIKKWKNLQEIIFKEKSLIDALFSYKNNDYAEIKKLIINHAEIKLKLRQMNYNNKIKSKEKALNIEPKIEQFNNESKNLSEKIQNFFFFLRKNIDYMLKLVLSINENNDKTDSLVELICNQFYKDLPSNNKHRQLMIIIYILLEKEICDMDYAGTDNFLNSNLFLTKILSCFCKKDEFTKYLRIILNPLFSSIEKEIEEKDILNLSLFEINNYINNKNMIKESKKLTRSVSAKIENKFNFFKIFENNNHSPNKESQNFFLEQDEINYKELTKEIWKNWNEFIDDLTQKKLYNMIKEEKNNYNKEIYKLQYERSFFNCNAQDNIYSNNKFINLLSNDSFNDNIELIINNYKQSYLFIHQKLDIFLLALINDIKLIPNNIRIICKIIYILISKKFPDLPKYLKNSFIGKFFFEQYIFHGLIMENKLIFENKIISFEAKKCIGEIISILSHANKCLLFNNSIDAEKAIYNNYILQIIPILDKFYNALIDIKLPKIIEKLLNLKLKELNSQKKKIIRRKRKVENINIININDLDNSCVSKLIKDYKKNKKEKFYIENSLWNLESIYFSVNDLLYILSLIDQNKNLFINLPKQGLFNELFQNIFSEKSKLESLIEENPNKQKFYIIFNSPPNPLYDSLKNKKFEESANNLPDLILNNIKYYIKILLEKLDIISNKRYTLLNMAFSNEKFFRYLYYSSLEIIQYDILYANSINEKFPIYLYGKYIIDNINKLEQKYVENDYEELYNIIYSEETYNLNQLRKYWDILIIKNDEKWKISREIINRLKDNIDYISNSLTIEKTEKVIFLFKIEAYVRVDIANKNDGGLPIIISDIQPEKKKNEQDTLINNIEEFINIFSENSNIFDQKLNIKPYNLIILDIVDGKNDNKIYDSILDYLTIVETKIKSFFPELKRKEIEKMIGKIKDYILKSIYKLVFPKNPLKGDIEFYKKTQLLDWVTPENFAIKNIDFAQLTFAETLIKNFEDSKSIDEKIKYIHNLHTYINNIFKFNTGKNTEIGQDELTPVLQYLIIKIQPRRIISNINYINCFLNDEDLISQKGFLMSQIDSAVSFVQTLEYKHLNISETEYNINVEKSRKKNNI